MLFFAVCLISFVSLISGQTIQVQINYASNSSCSGQVTFTNYAFDGICAGSNNYFTSDRCVDGVYVNVICSDQDCTQNCGNQTTQTCNSFLGSETSYACVSSIPASPNKYVQSNWLGIGSCSNSEYLFDVNIYEPTCVYDPYTRNATMYYCNGNTPMSKQCSDSACTQNCVTSAVDTSCVGFLIGASKVSCGYTGDSASLSINFIFVIGMIFSIFSVAF